MTENKFLAIFKKFGGIAHIVGLSYILFSAMAFGVAGYYYAEVFKVGDICEQVEKLIFIFIYFKIE